jgi:hypothetical protein
MTAALCIVLGFVLGVGAGKIRVKRGPVNIVRGMLLPHPGDERWRSEPCSYSTVCDGGLTIGEVRACPRHGTLWIGGRSVLGAGRYVKAVGYSHQERKALAAALGTP